MLMNEYEIEEAQRRFAKHAVLSRAARLLKAVKDHANANSDGWAYWPAPSKACKKLMELFERRDATETEYRLAVSPIRAFYTRRKKKTAGRYPDFPSDAV